MTNTQERISRAQGCLLGQLAGDSLGSLVEFQSSASISRIHKIHKIKHDEEA